MGTAYNREEIDNTVKVHGGSHWGKWKYFNIKDNTDGKCKNIDKVAWEKQVCLRPGQDFELKGSQNELRVQAGVKMNKLKIYDHNNYMIFEKDSKVNEVDIYKDTQLDFEEK